MLAKGVGWRKNLCETTSAKRLSAGAGFSEEVCRWTHSAGRVPAPHRLEPDHHRFRFQMYAPDFFDAELNMFFECEDFGGGGAAAIHNG